jgi:histidyl-tRNA synthetase
MALSTQPYKGARDFYPEDKRFQKWMFNKWRVVAERFGYEEYDAPILEPTELYLSKGNEEIIDEQTYTFKDRGGRSVTIRTEMTPSVSRMVAARRQELAYPLRWYSIPNFWRYERPQRGRTREFWQLNVDIFGVAGTEADQEIVQVADAIMQEFGAKREDYEIRINSRSLMDIITTEHLGMGTAQAATLVRLIDKIRKIDRSEFMGLLDALMTPSQREEGLQEKLMPILEAKSFNELPLSVLQTKPALKLVVLIELLQRQGISNAVYDPTLMRGFDYYTDMVFEVFDTDPENNRSMFGGGRYDGLVSNFGAEPVPTVGFGMGDVTMQNFLESHRLLPALHSETEVYVILIGDVFERAQKPISELRSMGLNVAVDVTGRKPDKQLRAALKKDVPFVVFIGEKELAEDSYKLKNLKTSKEEAHSLQRIVSLVKDHRRKARKIEDEEELLLE